ncbi:hypothetical protein RGQ21_07660 [Kitasatospora aureofaciens]|nr:hypothetical protein RGQ21_07660 [Kitasatospora aureofaciens]
MEDLADEECVVPIFIRCLGHLWGDGKFGQIGGAGRLAGDHRPGRRERRRAGRNGGARGAIGTFGAPGPTRELAERHGVATGGRTHSVRLSPRPRDTRGGTG